MCKIFKQNFNLKVSVIFFLFAVVLFFLARLSLFLIYNSNFADLSFWQIFKAFLNGFRFDYYVIALFLMPCLLMMNLPIKSRLWFKIWVFISSFIIFVMTVLLISDIIYFAEVNRHIAHEIVQIKYEMGFIINYALTQYWYLIIFIICVLGGAVWFLNKQINKFWHTPKFSLKKLAKICVIFTILILLGIRGHLGGGKALGIASVYNYAKTNSEALLMFNGIFSAYHIGRRNKTLSNASNYPIEDAIKEVQALFKKDKNEFKDKNFPIQQFPQNEGKVKDINFFIVMLEGWGKYVIGAYNPKEDTHTPYFDEMAKNGVLFTNAYATGQRSVCGFASIFGALPIINSLPAFGYGLEQMSINKMPKHFSDQGFYTFYVQSSSRDSYRMCTLARLLGVDESYGWEDIPTYMEYLAKPPYGYDYDALMFAADKIKARKQNNFLAMVFTGTTHQPFVKISDDFEIYKDGSWQSKYKNSIAYADYALGSLIKRAKEDGWFDNTVFIFLSDHIGGRSERNTVSSNFQIPLLIYAPKLLKAQKIDYTVSQLDIVPTIYALSNLHIPNTIYGNNLFDSNAPHLAMISTGVNSGIVTKDGVVIYDGKKIIEEEKFTPDFDANKNLNLLLALDKVGETLLKNNKWYKEVNSEK